MLRRPPGFTRTDTLLPSTTRVRAYDTIGDAISVDGPLSGTAGTTTYRYDRDRRRVGVISPDPDGAGSLKRRAARTSYADDEIGRAHVLTPVTNAHLVCRLLLEKKN